MPKTKSLLTQENDEGYKSYVEVWEKAKHHTGISPMMTYDEFVKYRKKFIKNLIPTKTTKQQEIKIKA
jgi:hypothetical protein